MPRNFAKMRGLSAKAAAAGERVQEAAGEVSGGAAEEAELEIEAGREVSMAISELLEQDRERLLGELTRAGSPDRAETVLAEELDRLLLRYNQAEDSALRRSAAAGMTETLRTGLALLDSAGETRVWESELGNRRPVSPLGPALLTAGCALCVAAAFLLHRQEGLALTLFPVLGAAFCGLGGFFTRGRGPEKGGGERKVEVLTDWKKVYRALYAASLVMDRNLEETIPGEIPAAAGDALDGPMERRELELLGNLLEAGCSGDGEFALERLDQVRHYLHSRGVETMDYTPETAAWFDRLPAMETATLRPALVRDGEVLLRGLAAEGA